MNRYQAEKELTEAGIFFQSKGWVPATAGNFSARIHENFLITRSGVRKGSIHSSDLILIDAQGNIIPDDAPHPVTLPVKTSAETLLHLEIYRLYPDAVSVLHIHSPHGTALSKYISENGADCVVLKNYELLKALGDNITHEKEEFIPVFPNSQDMQELSKKINKKITELENSGRRIHAYLLEGHGLYTWGRSIEEAVRHTEALEFMFECEVLYLSMKVNR